MPTTKKTSPVKTAKRTRGAQPSKARAAKKAPATIERGPSKETLAFAAKVVKARDLANGKFRAWAEVAQMCGVKYDHNGSSRLRRAYILGGGRTVGVRKAAK